MASRLGIARTLLDQHPIATDADIVVDVLERRQQRVGMEPAEQTASVVLAWIDTFDSQRGYRLRRPANERSLQHWLFAHLALLGDYGYPVEPDYGTGGIQLAMERVLANRRRPDLICRYVRPESPAAAGDLLVIKLKVHPIAETDLNQVLGYRQQVRTQSAKESENVFALLVGDCLSARMRQHLTTAGVGYVSLTELGYRRHRVLSRSHGGGLPST